MSSRSDKSEPDPDARVTGVASSRPVSQTLGPGFVLKGRYLIERELGRGGIGVVYLARDERLHAMPVVIKFLLEASGENAWLATKFLQEAEALTRINHPSVVKVIDRDTSEDGKPFFVMEFVSGRPLRSVMKSGGMDLAGAAPIIRQIGQALNAAHQQGIVHRDLKPENILLQHLSVGEEQVKLIDFGIAKVSDSQSGAATEVSIIAGSLQYIAPEQVNSERVSAATDIYALAIVAYEMITGRRPFETKAAGYLAAVQELAQLQRDERVISPRELRPDLPVRADALIRGALSFSPQVRPQDARVFGDELARALTQVPAPPGSDSQPASSPAEQTEVISYAQTARIDANITGHAKNAPGRLAKRGLWALVAASVLIVTIAAVWLTVRSGKTVGAGASSSSGTQPVTPSEITLLYSVTVQKDPRRYPGSRPFQLPGEVIFSPGDRIFFRVSSPASGYLYIINEGPADSTGASSYNALFPASSSRQGSAAVAANEAIRIPERGDGFVFDNQEGVEKLWIVWGAEPIPLLESVKRWANPDDKGEIKDAGERDVLRRFLEEQSHKAATIDKDEANKQTILRTKNTVLTRLVRMEHH